MPPATNNPRPDDEAAAYSVARAVRFCFTAVVLGFSYPNIHCALGIHHFRQIFDDMLGRGEPLPMVTTFVIHSQPFLVSLSIAVPIVAIALNFFGRLARSIYICGALVLLVFLQFFMTWYAWTSPLLKIIEKMNSPK